jgi:hypothetical protein
MRHKTYIGKNRVPLDLKYLAVRMKKKYLKPGILVKQVTKERMSLLPQYRYRSEAIRNV